MKKKLLTILCFSIGMLTTSAANAGHWVSQGTMTGPGGQEYEVFSCEQQFLTFGCRVGDIRLRPI